MSVQAIAWVLDEAPGVPARLLATLIVIANHADTYGKGAWPSQATMARQTRKSDRAVRADVLQLEELGLIVRGDQRIVLHIRSDRRPVVWDLPMPPRPEAHDRSLTAGRGVPGGSTRPVVEGRHDRKHASDNPSYKPNNPPYPPDDEPCPRHARLLGRKHARCRGCGTAGRPRCGRPTPDARLSERCGSGDGRGCRTAWCECACHGGPS